MASLNTLQKEKILLALFVATIFVSSFLLFLMQPLFARMLMPSLGGSPAVWVTSMVFYQVVLLLGYIYPHKLSKSMESAKQYMFHIFFVLLPLTILPIKIPAWWSPATENSPIPGILLLLVIMVGLPFLVLATSSPLIQMWFSRTKHTLSSDPYFLYAASNIGSILGLVSYPLLIEPNTSLTLQVNIWFAVYILFAALIITCAFVMRKNEQKNHIAEPERKSINLAKSSISQTELHDNTGLKMKLKWILWAFIPSSLMIGVTSYFSNHTDVNIIPFFWIIPLIIYLLSFIVTFSKTKILPQAFSKIPFTTALVVFFLIACEEYYDFSPLSLLLIHGLGLLYISVLCHKELSDRRPNSKYLTDFYIWMSVGGILGGVFSSIIAPFIFKTTFEYWLVLIACMFLYMYSTSKGVITKMNIAADTGLALIMYGLIVYVDYYLMDFHLINYFTIIIAFCWISYIAIHCIQRLFFKKQTLNVLKAIPLCIVALLVLRIGIRFLDTSSYLYVERSFYGISKVSDSNSKYMKIYHGNTNHGSQFKSAKRKLEPISYYHRLGPLGDFFRYISPISDDWNIGVVGLGAGGITTYSKPTQDWTYFEIDPVVKKIASNPDYFTYVSTYKPRIIIGDGRLSLAKEPDEQYNVLIFDAYNSDSIPIHLVTAEALQLYATKLKKDGFMLFHLSNRHLDLEPIVGNVAAENGLQSYLKEFDTNKDAEQAGALDSTWLIATKNTIAVDQLGEGWVKTEKDNTAPVWTDDRSSIMSSIK